MDYIRQAAGVILVLFGATVVIQYWIYWGRVLAQALGFGRVGFVSMAPFVGPAAIALGAMLFAEPLLGMIGWWVLLVDLNTWNVLISLPIAIWLNFKGSDHG